MYERVACLLATVLLVAPAVTWGEMNDAERFGERLSEQLETTPIEVIIDDPDQWAGSRVRVSGEVTGVCSRQGCWMDLTSPEDATLRIKVDDGVIVFPQEAIGHQAVAEGTVEILEMDREKFESWLRHVADEEGRDFDPAEVGEPPYRIVRLRGSGAEIMTP